jgi:tRNA A-37 threonylcarbamoyl transferase component Bud32
VRVAVIIGAILGPSVIGLILMVGVVVACLVWKKRKGTMKCQEHNSPAEQPMHNIGSNPIYNAPVNDNLAEPFYIAPTRNGDALYQSIDEAQMYEVPITTPESDSHHTYHVLEASRNPQHRGRGEDTANRNVSHTLTSPKQSEMQSEEGHDYHELESSTDDAGYELYVPCMEQRHTVYHNKGTMLYESLQKVQSSSPTSCDYFEESPSFWQPGSTTDSLYQQLYCRKFREICRHHVEATEHLGSGKFGTVKRGVWKTPGGDREVAVKMLQSNPASQDTIMFLQEAAIMGQFRHPNIVQLLGVVTLGEPIMIVLELLSSGDLSTFLNKNRAQELDKQKWPNLLLGFCQQVAAGLDYLLAKGFVHRDIAARNILLSPTHMMCKISDFGMSRDLQAENYYVTRGGDIPVKWTAPETLNYKKYSAATDIWSFGCLMYEIWGLGHKPFEGHTNMEAIELVERGYRLPPPPGCPRQVYHLMIQCWNPTASLRPSSSELLQDLTGAEESCLLQWREEDSRCHPQAHLLGAPLEAGESLYRELQLTYHFD